MSAPLPRPDRSGVWRRARLPAAESEEWFFLSTERGDHDPARAEELSAAGWHPAEVRLAAALPSCLDNPDLAFDLDRFPDAAARHRALALLCRTTEGYLRAQADHLARLAHQYSRSSAPTPQRHPDPALLVEPHGPAGRPSVVGAHRSQAGA